MGAVSETTWNTTDMSTAAYVKMKGLPLSNVERKEGNRFVFHFQDVDQKGDKLRYEFVNGEFSTYDHEIRSLKKMCYDRPRSAGRRG